MSKVQKTPGNTDSVVNSSPHRTTVGAFVRGLTNGRNEYESRNETNALAALFMCCDIKSTVFQQFKKSYLSNREKRFYTPDFIVEANEAELQQETENISNLENAENQLDKYLAIAASDRDRRSPLPLWFTQNCSSSGG